jgi:ketosteroid isomerase-like protein
MILPGKAWLAVVIVLGFIGGPSALADTRESASGSGQERTAILKMLNAQVTAWNHGELEGFMAGYWHSPELTFFSNDNETHGWQETLERYKKRYQGEGRAMGKLDFQDLRIEMLGAKATFVRGKWHLKMPDGKDLQGMFTLVLRKFPQDGWKIVHDHSSGT